MEKHTNWQRGTEKIGTVGLFDGDAFLIFGARITHAGIVTFTRVTPVFAQFEAVFAHCSAF